MKNKIIFGVVCCLIIGCMFFLFGRNKPIECTRSEELIEGITTKEELKVSIKKNKIKKINLKKEIILNEFYDERETYYDAIEDIMTKSYDYLGADKQIRKEDKKVIVEISTKDKGVILNNLSIKYNGEDKTTLRYDGVTDLKDETSIKINDAISKKEIKEKLKKIGYTCK